MKPKHIEFFDNLLASILTTIKVILLSKFQARSPSRFRRLQDCVLLGNGPSLSSFLQNHLGFLEGKDIFCVNFFVRSEAFVQVKPAYYVLAAPDFWQPEEKPGWKEERDKIFYELADKTDWQLTLFVPFYAKKHHEWKKILGVNPNINIHFFNNTPIEGLFSLSYFYFKMGLGMPRPHNVLVASIAIALNMNYKNCYIAGADHSWLQEIFVSDDNQVYLSQKHFYDDTVKQKAFNSRARPMYVGTSQRRRRLHEVLQKFYYSFRSYWELRAFAQKRKVNVFNVTPNSFIDAFDRHVLDD